MLNNVKLGCRCSDHMTLVSSSSEGGVAEGGGEPGHGDAGPV